MVFNTTTGEAISERGSVGKGFSRAGPWGCFNAKRLERRGSSSTGHHEEATNEAGEKGDDDILEERNC